jgi:glutaredoxin
MRLYVIPSCDECEETKEWIIENNKNIEIVELEKKDDSWFEKEGDDFLPMNPMIRSFPALRVGSDEFSFLVGKEGIISYIERGFLHEAKKCPFLNQQCIEKNCEKFVILKKGHIDEGACSDYMNSILLTEILMNLNKQRGQ